MKLITRYSDYALAALCCIAKRKGKMMTVSELAEELSVPYPFLRKIFQILNRKRIVKSFRGQGGGFTLSVPTNRIRAGRIIEIFQGPIEFTNCVIRKDICPRRKRCVVRKKLLEMEKRFVSDFCNLTIASLIK